MAVHNADIAAAFNQLADLLEIEEANPFPAAALRPMARAGPETKIRIAANPLLWSSSTSGRDA
ncbi:MAG: hypothetical protein ACHP84_09750 [Caulobacterales bacterium]